MARTISRRPAFLFSHFRKNTSSLILITALAASFVPQPERKGDTRGAFREPEAGIDKHGSGKPCF
jgi:hypothetical protein